METSRLILGGNLLSGYVHSRDLIYVSSLVLHYHQKDRIFRTLMLAEQSGVNTILSNPVVMPLMEEYWKEGYGKIQFISDCAGLDYSDGVKAMNFDTYLDTVKMAMTKGQFILHSKQPTYIEQPARNLQRSWTWSGRTGFDSIRAHKLQTVKVRRWLEHDFWMKHFTSTTTGQPSIHLNDNMYCFNDETIRYMETPEKPWIAFKSLSGPLSHGCLQCLPVGRISLRWDV
jgi:hypothetical protein